MAPPEEQVVMTGSLSAKQLSPLWQLLGRASAGSAPGRLQVSGVGADGVSSRFDPSSVSAAARSGYLSDEKGARMFPRLFGPAQPERRFFPLRQIPE